MFSPDSRGLKSKPDASSFAPRANTVELFAGTSDEFRYNKDDSQVPDKNRNIKIGDTVWEAGCSVFNRVLLR